MKQEWGLVDVFFNCRQVYRRTARLAEDPLSVCSTLWIDLSKPDLESQFVSKVKPDRPLFLLCPKCLPVLTFRFWWEWESELVSCVVFFGFGISLDYSSDFARCCFWIRPQELPSNLLFLVEFRLRCWVLILLAWCSFAGEIDLHRTAKWTGLSCM